MLNITLPDGKKLTFEKKVSGIKIAEKISKSLAKEALLMSVDGNLKDLSFEIEKDCTVKILTVQSFSISKLRSIKLPSTLITKASLARDLLIFSAILIPETFFSKVNFFPSGKVMLSIY